MMAVIDFSDGPSEAADPPHSHPHQQVSYVAAGELLVHIGDDATRLGPDDIFTVPDYGAEIAGMGRVDILVNIARMLSFQGGILVPSCTASKSGVRASGRYRVMLHGGDVPPYRFVA